MTLILRALGLGLLESIAARLPRGVATFVQFALLLVGVLLPLPPFLSGVLGAADVLAYFAFGMLLSVLVTVIRLRTMEKASDWTVVAVAGYALGVGSVSLMASSFAGYLLWLVGPSGGWAVMVPGLVALVLAQGWSLADGWFVRGGFRVARTWQVVLPGVLRVLPLHLAGIWGMILLMGDAPQHQLRLFGVLLIGIQAAIDVSLAVASLIAARRAAADGR